ncbi:MAG: dienelactone hydrolase family protein [Deltaproteobacteria bacterium]|nr:dienelactone hydrolase family protein [Deltaproteobacteria bacterium]
MIIKDEIVDLETPAGVMRTYVYRPVAPGKYPGILLFSEIFQQTGPIKRTAMILAGHGFVVAVPEIFHELEPIGTILAYDQAGADRGNYDKVTKTIKSYDDDARAVIKFLQSDPGCTGKLGSFGICIGGHLSFRASMNEEILAGVCLYATDIHKRSLGAGMNDNSLDRMGEIKGEMLMIWGRQDPHIPPEGREIIYNAMSKSGVNFTWHEFNGAHAFIRDEGHRYDPVLALRCYSMAIELFKRKLGEGDLPVRQ